jgi:hypothetical protein
LCKPLKIELTVESMFEPVLEIMLETTIEGD